MKMFKIAFCGGLGIGLAFCAWGGEFAACGCRAQWTADTLTLANAKFSRTIKLTAEGPRTVSLRAAGGSELIAAAKLKTQPAEITAAKTRFSPVGEEGVAVTVARKNRKVVYRIFPGAGGVLVDYGIKTDMSKLGPEPAEYRAKMKWHRDAGALYRKDGDFLNFLSRHIRVTEFLLSDMTDCHNELEQEKEWLLHTLERPRTLAANVMDAQDVLTGEGVVFVRLAPLPRSRPEFAPDFLLGGSPYGVMAVANGYAVGEVAYTGGDAGRARALQSFQRVLRAYRPGRDGIFLSNTWGDGNRDSRINEEFLMREVVAGGELGVDVIQIDDGWQKGRTANSAAVKKGGGTWATYWDVDPDFWKPCPIRFPNGLEGVVAAAKARGMKFGLWFGPDSSNDCAHWQDDADCLLDFHRRLGIDYFKMDSMVIRTGVAEERQRKMFNRMLELSQGAMTFDLDCTANVRPGYFGLVDIGPLFVENRYIRKESRLWWPHYTLRNAWSLAKVIDPVRLRMEVLNPERMPELYGNDPLSPKNWPADAVFATAMCFSPLGWFEISNLSPETTAAMKPLVATWKRERANIHGGVIHSVGARPDGRAWTGFLIEGADGKCGYALIFRELNENNEFELDLRPYFGRQTIKDVQVIGGRGKAEDENDGRAIEVKVPAKLDFVFVKFALASRR